MRVQLARIEGKMDLSNLRHDQSEARLNTIDGRLLNHSNQIGTLQARFHVQDGERKGVTHTVRIMWALGGSGIVGALAMLARHFAL